MLLSDVVEALGISVIDDCIKYLTWKVTSSAYTCPRYQEITCLDIQLGPYIGHARINKEERKLVGVGVGNRVTNAMGIIPNLDDDEIPW